KISYIYTNRLKEALSQLKQDVTCFYNSTTTQEGVGINGINQNSNTTIYYIITLYISRSFN
ncbi:hypothetical protein, partial [Bacillus wiedmannii]|uniref:hypothetical protein n=1 Tax=Bacillus wiedmannii TaxID=1890302 RepID=UPI001C6FC740